MYGLVMNEDECMVMVLKWDYGISSYGMNIWKDLSLEVWKWMHEIGN